MRRVILAKKNLIVKTESENNIKIAFNLDIIQIGFKKPRSLMLSGN
jgi:hypothetical protein